LTHLSICYLSLNPFSCPLPQCSADPQCEATCH